MRAILIIGAALVVAIAGATGEIIASFKSPAPNTLGIDAGGGYLCLASGRSIYVVNEQGQRIRLIGTNLPVTFNGVAYGARGFWVCTLTSYAYRLNVGGSVVASWYGPGKGCGIDYDSASGQVWYATPRWIYKLLGNGSVLGSFACSGVTTLGGISYDNGYVWTVDTGKGNPLYQYTPTGSLVRTVAQPGKFIYGVAAWPGGYLWYTNRADNWAYKVDVKPSAVAPASLGRVKALFR